MSTLDQIPQFQLSGQDGATLSFRSAQGDVAHVFVLESDIVRVMVLPGGKLHHPKTWAIAPGADDVATIGRDRFDLSGFSLPDYRLQHAAGQVCISTGQIRLTIELSGFYCHWETQISGEWHSAARDRATQSYNFGWWDNKVYHYLQRSHDEMYFGLGERAGDSNRHGGRYTMSNVDAMGYSARSSDPLYKHIPFYLTWKPASRVPFGLFYDTLADCHFDMGRELDNYHGLYRYFSAEHGDLDYWFIGGQTLLDVVKRYTWLTGRPALLPKWSLGYSGSTMAYTDADNAQQRMNEFLARCAEHDILCDSFHLSSGYTSIGNKRYVFHWNRDKFPDPAAFVEHYRAHGVKLIPNIKPCLLRDHPQFAEAAARGLLLQNPDGSPALEQFWDEVGAYLDFTHPDTLLWWQQQVHEQLLHYGMAATWNDNNEFEIRNPRAHCQQFGTPRPASEAKPLHTLLMLQASRAAQIDYAPQQRPFLVSRAGCAGMQRYVQTWSGDNYTSWETLQYNIKMSIGLSLSGVSNTGHDIGGFAGPAPDAELFLRWLQASVLMPRFSIHSWNDDHTANEPWMHPAITPQVRELIKLRYRYLPYLYQQLWRAHQDYQPIIRPTFLDFPDDARCYQENDDFLIGPDLLLAPVVAPGQSRRSVYLPQGSGWYEVNSGQYYDGGERISLAAPLNGQALLLARAGSAIALNVATQHFAQRSEQRGLALYPHPGDGEFSGSCFEDDGDSVLSRQQYGEWRWHVCSTSQQIQFELSHHGQLPPGLSCTELWLPTGETREVVLIGAQCLHDQPQPQGRCLTISQ
ncbi:glycoside hydrolase family 31 protein [Neisseriaceae bacterium TC5R-5]|nr:glycoside hydrolase family 31 protein [Neisseriaceae bacterium TC5R-5]